MTELCYVCEKPIVDSVDRHEHHSNERSKGNPRPRWGTRMVVHKWCHAWIHGWKYGWMKNQRSVFLEKNPEMADGVDMCVKNT